MGLIKKGSTAVTGIIDKTPLMPVEKVGGVECRPVHYGKPMSDYEIERDRRIHISGILQAVASSSAIMPFVLRVEDFSKIVEQETRKLLKVAQTLVDGK